MANAGAVGEASRRGAVIELGAPRPHKTEHRWETQLLVAAALFGLLSTAAAVVLAAQAVPQQQLAILGQAVASAVPIAVGIYAVRRGPYPRFAWLLLGAALGWSLIGLSRSLHPVPYSIGRLTEWSVEGVVAYLVLAFPTGRLRNRAERWVTGAIFALVGVLFLPTALLVHQYPLPAPFAACVYQCPHNALMVTATQPAFINSVVAPIRELLVSVASVAVITLLVLRIRRASHLVRRTQLAVLAFATLRFLSLVLFFIGRRAGASDTVLELLGWIWMLTLPGIALAFLLGIFRSRLFTADALQRLTLASAGGLTGPDLRHALSAALEDPSLQVLYRVDDDGWPSATEDGARAQLPARGSGLDATEVTGLRGQGLAIVHDEALSENRALVQAAGTHVLVALENQALQAQVRTSMRRLADSRAEALTAGEAARRKIRQNLHDGAQQRLVTLLLRLEMAGPQVERDPTRGARLFHDLADEVEQTLAEIRVLSHGLDPSLLTERGLVSALQAVAASAPLSTTIEVDGQRRYPPEIEACLYFVCMEALSNAYKHAAGATAIAVSLHEADGLELVVSDDGSGFDPRTVRSGLGMASMRERVASVGGTLSFEASPGRGTSLRAHIPMRYDRRLTPAAPA